MTHGRDRRLHIDTLYKRVLLLENRRDDSKDYLERRAIDKVIERLKHKAKKLEDSIVEEIARRLYDEYLDDGKGV